MTSSTESASRHYKAELNELLKRNKEISSEVKNLKEERQRNNKKIKALEKEWLKVITNK